MNRRKELSTLLIGDFVAINAAWIVYYWVRTSSGLFQTGGLSGMTAGDLIGSSIFVYLFWLLAFNFFGLYKSWFVRPPFDEIITVTKTLTIGTLFLTVFVWWDNQETQFRNDPRALALTYLGIVATLTISTRFAIRAGQRKLLENGIGRRPSVIIGEAEKVQELANRVQHYPRLGYEIVGFVTPGPLPVASGPDTLHYIHRNGKVTQKELARLGQINELETVIERHGVKEVLIALGSNEHDALVDVITRASKSNAGLKIVPDLYDIISGQARTREIYGFPLIDINPVLLRPWEEAAKRTLDILVSSIVLLAGLPLWILITIAVRLTSKGPAIYSQSRVGRDGDLFKIYKYRSMYIDAEQSGPQWASKNDPRVTPLGRFLRKTHLDEMPQFWNVLVGDMSLVGPRPERDFFVKKLTDEIPYYNRRHKVRPGITGLCQAMMYKYDENLEDVKNKVKYDLMYIESMSFRMDLKIILWTAFRMVRGKGHA